jgi:hypothetical protein
VVHSAPKPSVATSHTQRRVGQHPRPPSERRDKYPYIMADEGSAIFGPVTAA